MGSVATANQCVTCAAGCATCTAGTTSSCTTCGSAAAVNYYLAINTTICATTCPDGQYPDLTGGTHRCLACSPSCTKCANAATSCTFCKAPTGTNRFLLNGMCLLTCPQYFYGLTNSNAAISNICDACTPGCDVCTATGLASCTQCGNDGTSDYYLVVGTTTCSTSCPNGQFMGAGTNMHKCLSCNVECATCQTTSATCLTCASGYNQLNLAAGGISCLAQCPAGTYSSSGNCLSCPAGCSVCTGGTISTGSGQ